MRTILTIALLVVTSVLTAQNPKEKGVGDFTEVKVFDLIEVNLIKSERCHVVKTINIPAAQAAYKPATAAQ